MFIYGLIDIDGKVWYVGKTKRCLKKREKEHRSNHNCCSSMNIPEDIIWNIKLLEECDKDKSKEREGYYIDTLQPICNQTLPHMTGIERYTLAYRQSEEVIKRKESYAARHKAFRRQ